MWPHIRRTAVLLSRLRMPEVVLRKDLSSVGDLVPLSLAHMASTSDLFWYGHFFWKPGSVWPALRGGTHVHIVFLVGILVCVDSYPLFSGFLRRVCVSELNIHPAAQVDKIFDFGLCCTLSWIPFSSPDFSLSVIIMEEQIHCGYRVLRGEELTWPCK